VNTSLFELFKIGIGPSSSHTVGPMRAALRFARGLESNGHLDRTARVTVDLYGSLALTGIGHATDRAILLGLLGEAPDQVDPSQVEATLNRIATTSSLDLLGRRTIPFTRQENLLFHRDQMYPTAAEPSHPFYSTGGGFIVSEAEHTAPAGTSPIGSASRNVPYPFRSAAELLKLAAEHKLTIADLLLANEVALFNDPTLPITRPLGVTTGAASDAASTPPPTPEAKIKASILALWRAMQQSIERGIATEGILPGGLNVRRRANRLSKRLDNGGSKDPLAPIDWVTVYAMAVNEENAAGGRVVTAPTNGAAGVIPAIAQYYLRFIAGLPGSELSPEETDAGLIRYFLTAAAIGILYKENASISGAEVGCQGEVGVACSMAAGGLVAALNGTNEEIEHAAEIAMEHNLGMTCDPIGGLVQIPCIERNGMGAVKAINASRLAMHETEGHKLSLDQIIATMYQTGLDMQSRYKETSLAGLALNIIEC
jgi:L-serine dehydratase